MAEKEAAPAEKGQKRNDAFKRKEVQPLNVGDVVRLRLEVVRNTSRTDVRLSAVESDDSQSEQYGKNHRSEDSNEEIDLLAVGEKFPGGFHHVSVPPFSGIEKQIQFPRLAYHT